MNFGCENAGGGYTQKYISYRRGLVMFKIGHVVKLYCFTDFSVTFARNIRFMKTKIYTKAKSIVIMRH